MGAWVVCASWAWAQAAANSRAPKAAGVRVVQGKFFMALVLMDENNSHYIQRA
jgi:hypothetical protein